MGRKMEWAARGSHLGGIPRKMVFMAVGAFAKAVATVFNTTSVHNADTLFRLVRSRPPGVPLITVSNHMSTLDDPVMWGFSGFPVADANLARWVLAAEDICFKNIVLSYFFRLGKCIPITRGAGIYQEHMNEALDRLSDGAWVMPENFWFGRRPPVPLFNKNIKIIIGEPVEFDFTELRRLAMAMSGDSSFREGGGSGKGCTGGGGGGSSSSAHGLDEAAQRCLYTIISERIRSVMERLRTYGKTLRKP
ncbi:N-acylphosphatidylethanolamine synthase isoform X2 [Malania oleifera]|uniref:N-acylphosphatidylethanolamine synthase isoform X2 n=1 Tax=Malania oleifera TaxID=397392 RepID=UPI0025AE9909|nr:N-acylphosphatidylethanolamine synthase isoform X2 [Malania oleifera]